MFFSVLYSLACFLQGTLSIVNILAFIPQWIQLVKSSSSEGVSLQSWIIWLNSSIISCFYAIMQYEKTGSGTPLIITTFISVICNLITIVLILMNQPKENRSLARIQALFKIW